jgi:hypothetical protein
MLRLDDDASKFSPARSRCVEIMLTFSYFSISCTGPSMELMLRPKTCLPFRTVSCRRRRLMMGRTPVALGRSLTWLYPNEDTGLCPPFEGSTPTSRNIDCFRKLSAGSDSARHTSWRKKKSRLRCTLDSVTWKFERIRGMRNESKT